MKGVAFFHGFVNLFNRRDSVKQNVFTEDSWVVIPVASAFRLLDYVVLIEVYKEDVASCWYIIGNRTLQSP